MVMDKAKRLSFLVQGAGLGALSGFLAAGISVLTNIYLDVSPALIMSGLLFGVAVCVLLKYVFAYEISKTQVLVFIAGSTVANFLAWSAGLAIVAGIMLRQGLWAQLTLRISEDLLCMSVPIVSGVIGGVCVLLSFLIFKIRLSLSGKNGVILVSVLASLAGAGAGKLFNLSIENYALFIIIVWHSIMLGGLTHLILARNESKK